MFQNVVRELFLFRETKAATRFKTASVLWRYLLSVLRKLNTTQLNTAVTTAKHAT